MESNATQKKNEIGSKWKIRNKLIVTYRIMMPHWVMHLDHSHRYSLDYSDYWSCYYFCAYYSHRHHLRHLHFPYPLLSTLLSARAHTHSIHWSGVDIFLSILIYSRDLSVRSYELVTCRTYDDAYRYHFDSVIHFHFEFFMRFHIMELFFLFHFEYTISLH